MQSSLGCYYNAFPLAIVDRQIGSLTEDHCQQLIKPTEGHSASRLPVVCVYVPGIKTETCNFMNFRHSGSIYLKWAIISIIKRDWFLCVPFFSYNKASKYILKRLTFSSKSLWTSLWTSAISIKTTPVKKKNKTFSISLKSLEQNISFQHKKFIFITSKFA